MFTRKAINALSRHFKFKAESGRISDVSIQQAVQMTGLKNAAGKPLPPTIWVTLMMGEMLHGRVKRLK